MTTGQNLYDKPSPKIKKTIKYIRYNKTIKDRGENNDVESDKRSVEFCQSQTLQNIPPLHHETSQIPDEICRNDEKFLQM
jgi:hypothetical protein